MDQKMIKNKLGALRLAQTLGNVAEACRVMRYSLDSFYRFKELYDAAGEVALQEISRKKPILKNRIDPELERTAVQYAIGLPADGRLRTSNELKKLGLSVSAWSSPRFRYSPPLIAVTGTENIDRTSQKNFVWTPPCDLGLCAICRIVISPYISL